MRDPYVLVIVGGPEDGKIADMAGPIPKTLTRIRPRDKSAVLKPDNNEKPEVDPLTTITYDLDKVVKSQYPGGRPVAYFRVRKGEA